MNLINDLGTDIAFAFLVEKRHNEKIKSNDVLPLIVRVNEALRQITEKEELAEQVSADSNAIRFAAG